MSLSDHDRVPCVLVPQLGSSRVRQPAPPEPLLDRDVSTGKGARRFPQCRCGGSAAVDDEHRQTLQQAVDHTRLRRPRQVESGAGHLDKVAGARQTPGEHRCAPGAQIGLTRNGGVERLQTSGRLQQLRGCVAAQARGERDLPPQQVHAGAGKVIQPAGLGGSEQPQGVVERARL